MELRINGVNLLFKYTFNDHCGHLQDNSNDQSGQGATRKTLQVIN